MRHTYFARAAVATLLAAAVPALAQSVPGAVPRPDTHQGSMQLQKQEQERARNAQEQQRADQQRADQVWQEAQQQQQARHQADVAQGQAVLRTWQQRPLVPPVRNLLLGRWVNQGVDASRGPGAGGNAMAAQLVGGMVAAVCDNMLGQGLIEFRINELVAVGRDGRERVLYHLEYHGGGTRIAVLPKDAHSFTHMIVDFDSANHATVAGVGCTIARAGSAAAATAATGAPKGTTAPSRPGLAATRPDAPTAGVGAVLALQAGIDGRPVPAGGHAFWLLRGGPAFVLIRAGFQSGPQGSILRSFMTSCQRHAPECQKGLQALHTASVSEVRTDAQGRARTAPVPAGRYYVFGLFDVDGKPMAWQVPIDLHDGSNSLALNLRNADPVE